MSIKKIDNKRTGVINVFIDPERGFLDASLTEKNGGVLYVPDGEAVAPLMGDIIAQSRDTIFILAQDYHPANHISFMRNHPGIMAYRAERFRSFLKAHRQPEPKNIETAMQSPVHFFNGMDAAPVAFPFDEIVLDENRNIIGVKETDGRIRKVEVETSNGLMPSEHDRGRITAVLDSYFDKTFDGFINGGRLLTTQTLWTVHCVQGTPSSLYPAELGLPQGLRDKLDGDLMSSSIQLRDPDTGNVFFVVRKGADSEVDRYGIGVENDGETMTAAWDIFRQVAQLLKKQGCEKVIINIGGLATNFCVEFSANNVTDFLAGHFKMRGMDVDVNFVPDISRGIPVPGGADVPFSLDGTEKRLKRSRNINAVTLPDVIKMGVAPAFDAGGASPARKGLTP